jgi:hypothetical protein
MKKDTIIVAQELSFYKGSGGKWIIEKPTEAFSPVGLFSCHESINLFDRSISCLSYVTQPVGYSEVRHSPCEWSFHK